MYQMKWFVRSQPVGLLSEKAAGVVEDNGATRVPHETRYGSSGFTFPFQLSDRQRQLLRPPYLWLTVTSEWDGSNDAAVDLTCSEGVLAGPFARENLKRLVALGDMLYGRLHPHFGWGNGTGEISFGDQSRFRHTGLPIWDQFTYVGTDLLDLVDWSGLHQRRVVITRLGDGGIRVERAPNRHLPRLDLPADEPFGLSGADLTQ